MDKYFISTRTWGFAKDYLKTLGYTIAEEQPNKTTKREYVPHLTFLRPFKTKKEESVIQTFQDFCKQQAKLIKFTINGLGIFENEEPVIYAKIEPNQELENLTQNLEKSLSPLINFLYPQTKLPYEKKTLHYTIAEGIKNPKEIISRLPQERIEQYLLRICLLKNKLILREYDFALEELLIREQAKNPSYFKKTIKTLQEKTKEIPTPKGFVKL